MPEAYNSIHTGEQIDEGIAVILNNDIPGLTAEAKQAAKESESFAKGGTGTRPGEDTDNAKYYSELAAGSAGGVVGALTFNGRSGNVLPEKGDYGVAQGVPILDETNKVPKELLPELGTNIPRSPTPPTDPETKLYIDTSVQNDSFYTAKEIDSKFASLSVSNPNFIVNSWFQVLQTPMVFNEVRDRWFIGVNNNPRGPLVLPPYDSEGLRLDKVGGNVEFVCTQLMLQKIKFPSDKLTVSARYTDIDRTERSSSFTFPSNLEYNVPVRSSPINHIQFQIIKKVWDRPDPNLSNLIYDKYLVYFKIAIPKYEQPNRTFIRLHNVKLELGSTSTIDQEAPLSYAEDLLQCQRFRMIYRHSQISGVVIDPSYGYISLPLKTSLINSPYVQNVVIQEVYLSSGKKLSSGFEIPRNPAPLENIMDDTSLLCPIKFEPNLTSSDIGPFICPNSGIDAICYSYPNQAEDDYVFPDDPT